MKGHSQEKCNCEVWIASTSTFLARPSLGMGGGLSVHNSELICYVVSSYSSNTLRFFVFFCTMTWIALVLNRGFDVLPEKIACTVLLERFTCSRVNLLHNSSSQPSVLIVLVESPS